jgi:hypothetical protein
LLIKAPTKHCQLHPVPTWLLKRHGDELPLTLALMCNLSFQQWLMPAGQKVSIIRPILKELSLDPYNPASYRPMLNPKFVSKLVERAADARLTAYCTNYNQLPVYQSACRSHYSTETAIVILVY